MKSCVFLTAGDSFHPLLLPVHPGVRLPVQLPLPIHRGVPFRLVRYVGCRHPEESKQGGVLRPGIDHSIRRLRYRTLPAVQRLPIRSHCFPAFRSRMRSWIAIPTAHRAMYTPARMRSSAESLGREMAAIIVVSVFISLKRFVFDYFLQYGQCVRFAFGVRLRGRWPLFQNLVAHVSEHSDNHDDYK